MASIDFNNIIVKFMKNILSKFDNNDNLINYFNINKKLLHMNLNYINNLFILIPDDMSNNLIHSDEIINLIIHNIEYFVFNNDFTFTFFYKKKINIDKTYTSPIIDEFKNNWNDIKIYNYDIGLNTTIFYYNNDLFYIDKYNYPYIININDNKYIKLLIDKSLIPFKQNIITNVIISSDKIGHIIYYKNNFIAYDIYVYKNDNVYYSCFDELIFDLENISVSNEQKKRLTTGGFIINYKNNDYIITTYIYQKICDIIPSYKNINKCFIELYKNDNLSFVINFMSPYSSDIIKRVNSAVKTLSREFLNIYHVTRKKANSELYNILSNNYKTILFDLHKIFIYARKNDDSLDNNSDDFYEKKSMNHDIVYKYLKKINIDLLCNVFIDRLNLLNNIVDIKIDMNNVKMSFTEFKILFSDCIHTKTMSVLLKL